MITAISRKTTTILLLLTVAIAVAPMVLPGVEGKFLGTDDAASEAIEAARPGYEPWASPVWEPPSKEIESLLFALQAAIGAGVLGYALGRRHGSRGRDVADR